MKDAHEQLAELTDRVRFLEGRAEDAEGRARRSNLRIVGLPEGSEGQDPLHYMEEWLKSFMPADTLTPFYSIERAHRVPGRRPAPGAMPRPILVKILHFKDQDAILKIARTRSPLKVNGAVVMIFPDYTLAIQQQRASFTGVKKRLREMELKYSLMFPAKLRVIAGEKTFFFDDPRAAWDWIEKMGFDPVAAQAEGWERRPRRKRRTKEQKKTTPRSRGLMSPTAVQALESRRDAMAAVMSLNNALSTTKRINEDTPIDTDETSSTNSMMSQTLGPQVTPQTADSII